MVKKGILSIIGCFICLVLVFSASSAYALSIADSAAYIDWSSFTFTYSGIGISWLGKDSHSAAEARDDIDDSGIIDDWKDGWVDTGVTASVPNAEGNARTTDDELAETTHAEADGIDTQFAYSWAMAERYGIFEALGSGTLTLSVDYYLSQDLSTEYWSEYAFGWSDAGLDLYNFRTGDWEEAEEYFWNEAWDGDSVSWADSGTLAVSLDFEAGDIGDFYAWVENEAEAYSVIPEPTSLMLLGFGLFGFGLARKKKKF